MPKANLTTTADITTAAREIDFVTRFGRSWQAISEVLGIMRPIKKAPGTRLASYKATITLEDGNVAEGEDIPLSKAKVTPVKYEDLTIDKYAKGVTIESVEKYGADIAIEKTDEAFRNELIGKTLDKFYAFLQTGSLKITESTFQMGIAMAIAKVKDKFKKMRKDVSSITVFVNTIDSYRYLGAAQITMQNAFGMSYIENFLGAEKVIVSSEIPENTVIAVPSDNIVLYYIDPNESQFAQLGLKFTTEGETNLIGFHSEGVYKNMTGETYAVLGMTLWAEYLDAVAVCKINPIENSTE